ncbi:ABC transporter ATP-binding protein [Gracilinema caldarium]|uniref:Taurine-transporting ATPase n=1 Tax=Gracilinema caldarium (strain ATCC 51460 / DSM 7334 / H1) TaxID=744872 RepID=F8F2Q9_GRAC1|nr:ABC transporter ATP-binding protein [Gracilinema caldarium]AEJ19453.1 Taurine-transporting ATPase [Gracilinema caldarium DSM 7334]
MNITIEHLLFSYPNTDRALFQDFSLYVQGPGVCALLGPSGCGKTTLLRLIAGFLKPQAGTLSVEGPLSYVFQESRLFPWLSIIDNVSLPLFQRVSKTEAREKALFMLEQVGLADKAFDKPAQLSGGQQQRVSLVRAFLCPASVMLMDEPFQALDVPLRIQLMDLFLRLLQDKPRLVLAVTHDPREAIYLADRTIILQGQPLNPVWDKKILLSRDERCYSSPAHAELEAQMFAVLTAVSA